MPDPQPQPDPSPPIQYTWGDPQTVLPQSYLDGSNPGTGFPDVADRDKDQTPTTYYPHTVMGTIEGAGAALGGDISDLAHSLWQSTGGTIGDVLSGQLQPGTPEFNAAAANTAGVVSTLSSPLAFGRAAEGGPEVGMPWRRPPPERPPPAAPAPQAEPEIIPPGQPGGPREGELHPPEQPGGEQRMGFSPEFLHALVNDPSRFARIEQQYPVIAQRMRQAAENWASEEQARQRAAQWYGERAAGPPAPEGPRGSPDFNTDPVGHWRDRAERYRRMGLDSAAAQAEENAQRAARGESTPSPQQVQQNLSDQDRLLQRRRREIGLMRGEPPADQPHTRGLNLQRAGGSSVYDKPGQDHWLIHNSDGQKVGWMRISVEPYERGEARVGTVGKHQVYPRGTKHLHVDMVGSYIVPTEGRWAEAAEAGAQADLDRHAGSYGVGEVKQLLRELRRIYKKEGDPDPPKFIDGFRISGMRGQKGVGNHLKYKIPLQAGIPLPPIPFDASDEDIDRIVNEAQGNAAR